MKISDRLSKLRIKLGITQSDASFIFDIPLPSWKNYEKGPSEPGAGALRKLLEGGVNINWLLTGEGEILLSEQAKAAEKTIFTPIDTVEFQRIYERLLKKDFAGHGFHEKYISYFTALVYNRVMSQLEEQRNEMLEIAVKELGLIIHDQLYDNLNPLKSFMRQHFPQLPDDIEKLWKEYDDRVSQDAAELGSLRGKFEGRILSPGSQLESEFLKGISFPSDS